MSKRIAFIWSRLPSYALACLTNLKDEIGDDLFVGSFGSPPTYITDEMLSGLHNFKSYKRVKHNKIEYKKIINDLELFNPDVLIVTGWTYKILLDVAKYFKSKGVRTVSMVDTPWKGSAIQIVKSLLGRRLLKKSFSNVWVPGIDAKRLMSFSGFNENDIWDYLYCCDSKIYVPDLNKIRSKNIVYIGRLEPEKNIIGLRNGFLEFFKDNTEFELTIIGDGSQKSLIDNVQGINFVGWKSSNEIISYLKSATAFILPSLYEPWGVVVHEAASCGVPLLLSNKVGARNEFLVNNYNGKSFDPNNKYEISSAINFVVYNNKNNVMGNRSYEISKHLNTEAWTNNLLMNVKG